jgi:hypothetical protein
VTALGLAQDGVELIAIPNGVEPMVTVQRRQQ